MPTGGFDFVVRLWHENDENAQHARDARLYEVKREGIPVEEWRHLEGN